MCSNLRLPQLNKAADAPNATRTRIGPCPATLASPPSPSAFAMPAAERIGVFAEPEVVTRQLTAQNPFIVIASDGVFEFLPSQSVVDMVGQGRGGERGRREWQMQWTWWVMGAPRGKGVGEAGGGPWPG